MQYSNNDSVDEDFVTVIIDGAYLHFLEGFVSMIFYQDRVLPTCITKQDTNLKAKRRIMFETRLAINRARQLSSELETGLKAYRTTAFFGMDRDFWTGLNKLKQAEHLTTLETTEDETRQVQRNSLMYLIDHLPKEGQEEVGKLVVDLLYDNEDKIREIAKKFPSNEEKIQTSHEDAGATNEQRK